MYEKICETHDSWQDPRGIWNKKIGEPKKSTGRQIWTQNRRRWEKKQEIPYESRKQNIWLRLPDLSTLSKSVYLPLGHRDFNYTEYTVAYLFIMSTCSRLEPVLCYFWS